MKDFYDIWLMSQRFDFDGAIFARAIKETFARRRTEMQADSLVLVETFAADPSKQQQWQAFLRRNKIDNAPSELGEVTAILSSFLGPIVKALTSGAIFSRKWAPGGPWK